MTREIEKVNWNLVEHYAMLATISMNAMEGDYSDEARQSLMQTAVRYLRMAMQQVEHGLTGMARNHDPMTT